jgi:hypothetical protein
LWSANSIFIASYTRRSYFLSGGTAASIVADAIDSPLQCLNRVVRPGFDGPDRNAVKGGGLAEGTTVHVKVCHDRSLLGTETVRRPANHEGQQDRFLGLIAGHRDGDVFEQHLLRATLPVVVDVSGSVPGRCEEPSPQLSMVGGQRV